MIAQAPEGLTRTQQRLFGLLSDGVERSADECLRLALDREHASESLVKVHIWHLRKRIEPLGFKIASRRGHSGYRLIEPEGVSA